VLHSDTFKTVNIVSANASLPLVIIVYLPPTTRTAKFLIDLSNMFSSLFLYKRPLLIIDDLHFNVDDISYTNAKIFKEMCDMFGTLQNTCENQHSLQGP